MFLKSFRLKLMFLSLLAGLFMDQFSSHYYVLVECCFFIGFFGYMSLHVLIPWVYPDYVPGKIDIFLVFVDILLLNYFSFGIWIQNHWPQIKEAFWILIA